jgi:hypothetical protein
MENHCETDAQESLGSRLSANSHHPTSSLRKQGSSSTRALHLTPASQKRSGWARFALPTLLCLVFAGCETLQYAPRKQIAQLPVFKVNEAPGDAGDHVTHYPSGTLFPIEITAEGSMFGTQAQSPLLVQLSRDVYVYKQWASFDGKRWTNSHKLFDLRVDGGLTPKGAQVKFEWDAR